MVAAASRVEGSLLTYICAPGANIAPGVQVAFGFGLSPWIVQQLQDFPQFAFGFGPLASQIGLTVTAGALIQRVFARKGINTSEFFRYDAQPGDLAVAVIVVGITLAGNLLASKFSGGSGTAEQMPRSVAEVQSIVALQQPVAVFGAGAASIIAAPWIEERIYRGVILQGLLPYCGPFASVRIHSLTCGTNLKGQNWVGDRQTFRID